MSWIFCLVVLRVFVFWLLFIFATKALKHKGALRNMLSKRFKFCNSLIFNF